MVPVAMVRIAPLVEPTILEVLAIGVSTEDIGSDCELWGGVPDEYRTSTSSWGTLTVTEDRPVYTDPGTPSTGSGTASSGKPRISWRC